jgi:hypothetical protein
VDVETPRLDAKMDELRELIRQANEALKDLKAAIKEARGIAAESAEVLRKEFGDKFDKCAKDTLDEWAKVTLRGIDMAESRINARFDKLGNILDGRGKGWQAAANRYGAGMDGQEVRHLKIWFMDGTEEELESKWTQPWCNDAGTLLVMYGEMVGGSAPKGATYVLSNIKKYEWVEGYK